MMSYAERDLPDLIENIKRLEAECESWRKQFRECAIELAAAEKENAKLRDVVEASKWLLQHVNRDYSEWKEPLEKALAALETTNGN